MLRPITHTIGFRSSFSISAKVWTVSCKLPSPVTRIPRLYFPFSFAAWKAPVADGVAYPILPQMVWLYIEAPLGSLESAIPKADVPVSAIARSPGRNNLPSAYDHVSNPYWETESSGLYRPQIVLSQDLSLLCVHWIGIPVNLGRRSSRERRRLNALDQSLQNILHLHIVFLAGNLSCVSALGFQETC